MDAQARCQPWHPHWFRFQRQVEFFIKLPLCQWLKQRPSKTKSVAVSCILRQGARFAHRGLPLLLWSEGMKNSWATDSKTRSLMPSSHPLAPRQLPTIGHLPSLLTESRMSASAVGVRGVIIHLKGTGCLLRWNDFSAVRTCVDMISLQ